MTSAGPFEIFFPKIGRDKSIQRDSILLCNQQSPTQTSTYLSESFFLLLYPSILCLSPPSYLLLALLYRQTTTIISLLAENVDWAGRKTST